VKYRISLYSLLFLFTFSNTTMGFEPLLLDDSNVCEPSAALPITCTNGAESCLLVGDNEKEKSLYRFSLPDTPSDSPAVSYSKLKFKPKTKIEDIEGLTSLGTDTALIMGSHSRDSRCGLQPERRLIATVQVTKDGINVQQKSQSNDISCALLFGEAANSQSGIAALCTSIDAAETAANDIVSKYSSGEISSKTQAKGMCSSAAPFNAEGIVALTIPEEVKVWVGLRSPLVGNHPLADDGRNLAAIMRMKDTESFVFDAVAFLDMNGRGVRELAYANDQIWVIAGPAQDSDEEFLLYAFSPSDLVSEAIIAPRLIRTLPTSSEGLAFVGGSMYVVIDGEGRLLGKCKVPGKYLRLSIPVSS
jgi:hypothetical protein